jgi:putative peptidoglycan lipid II flippase
MTQPPPTPDTGDRRDSAESTSILGSSAVMAAGTVVSRISGFLRSALLVAALGNQLHADVFTIANTIPNMLYILLAGGVFNAVLVPQLVRAMRNDADGGDGYTNRIITLAALFLGAVTVLLVVVAPWLMRLFLDPSFFTPELADQRESVIAFARYCLPQVFFYGMFVLVGQVLNARGRFGPMMWAPIANNVIAVAVLGAYLAVYGAAEGAQQVGGYTSGQELLLGLGSTLGIAAQFAILLPYMRAAGFRFRPRFDFRGTGLGHTLRLGVWTVLFVVVNQVAYTIVVRLASSGTADAVTGTGGGGTGYTVYSNAFLLVMVPHSVATVSLATAMLPRLSEHAASDDLEGVSRNVASTLRTTYALIIPFALLLPLVALPLSNLLWGYGSGRSSFADFAVSLALFAPGLVFFTTHYLMLRGFYALERTRTVFWVQCLIAAVNIGLAVWFTSTVPPARTAPGLVLAYGGAYLVGAACSYALLRHTLGGLHTPTLLRFLGKLLVAAGAATGLALALDRGIHAVWTGDGGKAEAVVTLVTVAGLDVVVFLLLARLLRISEVTSVLSLVGSRLRR